MLAAHPMVSVVMPVHNRAAYIGDALQSVCDQDYPNWELLVIDDASTDNSRDIVAEYAQRDPRITLFTLDKNSGNPARPRNIGMNKANGRYVAFLDSDDMWLPTKLREQVDFMQTRGSLFSFTPVRRISPDGKTEGRVLPVPKKMDLKTYLGNVCICPSTVMLDAARLPKIRFDETLKVHEDFDFFTKLLKHTRAESLNVDLTRYRRGHASLSRNVARVAFNQASRYMKIGRDIGYAAALNAFSTYAFRSVAKRLRF